MRGRERLRGRRGRIAAALAATLLAGGVLVLLAGASAGTGAEVPPRNRPPGVCPPFHLRDDDGRVIDPVKGTNAGRPYSPKQTCGTCHDYERITRGYHFTMGKGEAPTADQASRCQWALTPGIYGGTWCSPAPLYRYLSPKRNDSPATMDMTSFTFLTVGCGKCHPGGGSAEYDRDGKRYDRWMADPASGFSPGGENGFDGDYYKARWSETGVLEADCLLCHLPEYDMAERRRQIGRLNFRWAATAGARLADVTGSVEKGEPVTVAYDAARFNPDGTLSPHIVREPRNATCLACHAKPGWKKRGANFRPRTDVHLAAGLKCVDCHPAGSSADDPRINGHEQHQIAKGDDPGGHVRDDLGHTMPTCADCHTTGRLGAPVAGHPWLPPLHLERLACQACHVPERTVKAALVQAGDVFNLGTRIPTKGKHLWTFYGPDGAYWNHYGDLVMMGYDDKPTFRFRPRLARYKGKIYPVNRVHSAWPAIETEGKPGLMQPRMGDIYKMWTAHKKDAAQYPELAEVTDDTGDGVAEVNRPAEIDALIASVTSMLKRIDYPMDGKRVVWAMDDRVYTSGTEFRALDKHLWEASPYANVHTYNHDVYPAKAALGARGCTECHRPGSDFFFAPVLQYRFDERGEPVTRPQYEILGLTRAGALAGAWREAYGKPVLYAVLAAALLVGLAAVLRRTVAAVGDTGRWGWRGALPILAAAGLAVTVAVTALHPACRAYALPGRAWLDGNHFLVAAVAVVLGVAVLVIRRGVLSGTLVVLGLLATGAAGTLMLLDLPALASLTRAAYTAFDAGLIVTLLGAASGLLPPALGRREEPDARAGT
jgi:hypothetical protein